jgi:hypothetical protein
MLADVRSELANTGERQDRMKHFRQRGRTSSLSVRSLPLGEATADHEKQISNLLHRCPFATIFHSMQWNRALSLEFDLQPTISVVHDGQTAVAFNIFYARSGPLGLKASWSPPRIYNAVYGGPVFLSGHEDAVAAVLTEQERASGTHTTYVITPPGFDSSLLRRAGYTTSETQTVVFDLSDDAECLWRRLGPKRRNMVRRARRDGVEIRQGSPLDVAFYHGMLRQTMATSGREPLRQSFFLRLVEELVQSGFGSFLVGIWRERVVAGAVLLHFGHSTVYWSGASCDEGRKLAANDLLQWSCILAAKDRGSVVYDLLAIDAVRLPGIAAFKKGFGGTVVDYCSAVKRTFLGQIVRGFSGLKNPSRIARRALEKSI